MPKDHFRSRGFIEGGIIKNADSVTLDIAALPPFLRTLLVADGTVTKSLEAFFWERVNVETIVQHEVILDSALPALDARLGDRVLHREIQLRGADSERIFAYANSYLRTDLLAQEIKENLLNGKIGIGELIREIGVETYREIISLGEDRGNVHRTYLIHIGGKPSIQITESFPLSEYRTD